MDFNKNSGQKRGIIQVTNNIFMYSQINISSWFAESASINKLNIELFSSKIVSKAIYK